MEMAWAGTLLDINSILRICQLLKEILANESNIVNVQSPIIVCGDLHGQFDDLVELLKLNGRPPDVNYLFLGDYGKILFSLFNDFIFIVIQCSRSGINERRNDYVALLSENQVSITHYSPTRQP